jgi:hypothetical protein
MGTTNLQPEDVRPGHAGIKVLRATLADPLRIAALVSSSQWLSRVTVLKRDRRSSVLAGRIDSLPVVVKSLLHNRPSDGFSMVFGTTRGLRQWRGAKRLASRGFATPELLVLSRGKCGGRFQLWAGNFVETLVMERLEGPTLLEVIAGRAPGIDAAHPRHARLARAAGELVAAMSRAGVRNRDLKPSNLIVLPSPPEIAPHRAWTLAQIDTVGVQVRPDADHGEMLFRLLVECVGTGNTPSRTLRWRAALAAANGDSARAKTLWRNVESRLARHGDPTPKVNPLGPA